MAVRDSTKGGRSPFWEDALWEGPRARVADKFSGVAELLLFVACNEAVGRVQRVLGAENPQLGTVRRSLLLAMLWNAASREPEPEPEPESLGRTSSAGSIFRQDQFQNRGVPELRALSSRERQARAQAEAAAQAASLDESEAEAELAAVRAETAALSRQRPLRASVASKSRIAVREGAPKTSRKIGARSTGQDVELIGLSRTDSGTTRAELAEGGWVTAVTSAGKTLLWTEDPGRLTLQRPSTRKQPSAKPAQKMWRGPPPAEWAAALRRAVQALPLEVLLQIAAQIPAAVMAAEGGEAKPSPRKAAEGWDGLRLVSRNRKRASITFALGKNSFGKQNKQLPAFLEELEQACRVLVEAAPSEPPVLPMAPAADPSFDEATSSDDY